MQAPAPGQRPGMPPAGGPGGAPAPGPGGMPMQPMIPHQVMAMAPRPYPNPVQMMQPVGMAGVARMQMMEQQAAPQPPATGSKGKAKKAAAEKSEPPAA